MIMKARAYDRDSGLNGAVTYALHWPDSQPPFAIDSDSGLILLTANTLDRAARPIYFLDIRATDQGS